jgi:predicted methyltransferase
MDKYYKISELKEILLEIEKTKPHKKYISVKELTCKLNEVNRALIYNLDDIIGDLRTFLNTTNNSQTNFYTEAEILKILKVNRTTLYYWRTSQLVRYAKLNNTLIRYKLHDLLHDLENMQVKSNDMSQ